MSGRGQYLKIRDRKSGEKVCLKVDVTLVRGIGQSVSQTSLSFFLLSSCNCSLLSKPKRKLMGKGPRQSPRILFSHNREQVVKSGKISIGQRNAPKKVPCTRKEEGRTYKYIRKKCLLSEFEFNKNIFIWIKFFNDTNQILENLF